MGIVRSNGSFSPERPFALDALMIGTGQKLETWATGNRVPLFTLSQKRQAASHPISRLFIFFTQPKVEFECLLRPADPHQ